MKIEIVEFYPIKEEKNITTGTLHIYLCDYDIDLRGVFVSRKNNNWFFKLPVKSAMEGGEKVQYPVFSFTNRDKYRELIDELRKEGIAYIKNELKIL